MTKFGFQLYSLHGVDEPLPDVIERVGDTTFDGVEFAGLGDATVEELTETLDRTELSVAGAHIGLTDIEDDPESVGETYRSLGCSDVAVAWIDPEHFESRSAVETIGHRLGEAADALAPYDINLHYHNHDQEFTQLNGDPAIAYLLDAADNVGFEVDLGWAGVAGYDPLQVLRDFDDRIDLVHLKDYDAAAGETSVVGEGDLDLEEAFAAVREQDVDWIIYEAEERPDSYDTLDGAAAVVNEHW
ncbi:sugar phosphate isomerase/epimerase family protein [Halosolutus gelatinilyticus]|uniref:sugar phosphate isomerase/epimerase family protein n=1 Tax=Halosolutus gelatinilyticus TaxID=2931975 RepID=UPI001FF5B4F6|nr:sugar phosphate isomerase/epimerase [Halosolutus gelatinilyticus]